MLGGGPLTVQVGAHQNYRKGRNCNEAYASTSEQKGMLAPRFLFMTSGNLSYCNVDVFESFQLRVLQSEWMEKLHRAGCSDAPSNT